MTTSIYFYMIEKLCKDPDVFVVNLQNKYLSDDSEKEWLLDVFFPQTY